MGGIGFGSIGLAGNGELVDWEIFNRPTKGSRNGYSHMAIRTRTPDGTIKARVLQGDHSWDLSGQRCRSASYFGYGFGPLSGTMAGMPHFRDCTFTGEFPIATLDFGGEDMPVKILLTAFNPLIPMQSDDSSIPAAFFEIHYENTTDEPLEFSAAFAIGNPFAPGRNEAIVDSHMRGIRLVNTAVAPDHLDWGELVLATQDPHARIQPYWYRGGWQDPVETYWREFSEFRPLMERNYDTDGKKIWPRFVLTVHLPRAKKKAYALS